MGKTKELRRQLKQEKVREGFESMGYKVTQWFIDPSKNTCLFILVRNDVNNIEFVCLIPSNFHLPCNDGLYVYADEVNTPDVDDAISMWNECHLDKLFIRIHDKVVIRMSKHDHTVYTCMTERPSEDEIDTLARYANEMTVLVDEMEKISEASSEEKGSYIVPEKNPFDVLLDGGSFEKAKPVKVEDVQPCVLVEYNGYTLGQALPVMEFIEFFNRKDSHENINIIAHDTKTIYDFQTSYIKKLFTEALANMDSFKETVKSSYDDYLKNLDEASRSFNTIQAILEKNSGTSRVNDIASRANATLRILLDEQIEKRDKMIGLLETIRRVFGEV